MNEMVAGFQLREGITASDLDTWPPFVEWFETAYGETPDASVTSGSGVI